MTHITAGRDISCFWICQAAEGQADIVTHLTQRASSIFNLEQQVCATMAWAKNIASVALCAGLL